MRSQAVLLLLLGTMATSRAVSIQTNANINQKNGQGEKAVAEGKSQGQSLIEALATTDLDMSSFQGLIGQVEIKSKQKNKDEEGDKEEGSEGEHEQEDSENKEEESEDSKKDSDSKEDSKKKDDDSEQRTHGRDKNGMYKNHQNYVKLRNKINEEESGHQQMFDSITEKLSDRNFIQSAINNGRKHKTSKKTHKKKKQHKKKVEKKPEEEHDEEAETHKESSQKETKDIEEKENVQTSTSSGSSLSSSSQESLWSRYPDYDEEP